MNTLRRRIMVLGGGDIGGYVDLGLPSDVLWAVGNLVKDSQGNYAIGAETDYGTYVSWGNIDGHNKGEGYNFNNTTYNGTPGNALTASIPSSDSAHDICLARLGAPWRLPTKEDFQELYDNTDRKWTTINDVKGWKFMKKTDHSVFVFFLAAGYYSGTSLKYHGSRGYYWASSYNNSYNEYNLSFISSNVYPQPNSTRYYGFSVRPICKPMFSITITLTGDSVEGITVTVRDSDGTSHSGTTDSNGVVRLSGVVGGSAKVSASGYGLTNSSITVNASSRSFTCGLAPLGVWAYYADGSLKSEAEADLNAIGVAVITNNCGFVIDKQATNSDSDIRYGGFGKDLSSIGLVITSTAATAKRDFNGEGNTTKIITALSGYNDGYVTGAAAAEACRAAFGGNGYMGSLGEWNEAYANKASVDSMMTKIGGTAISTSSQHWASTLCDASTGSWLLYWNNGYAGYNTRNTNFRVRAFRAL